MSPIYGKCLRKIDEIVRLSGEESMTLNITDEGKKDVEDPRLAAVLNLGRSRLETRDPGRYEKKKCPTVWVNKCRSQTRAWKLREKFVESTENFTSKPYHKIGK